MIAVRVQPRAGRDEIAGERDGAILVRLKAAPEGGRANRALVKLLARRLGVAQGAVEIVRGSAARDKLVRVSGLDDAAVRKALLSNKRPAR
jgi:hypothetical protein